MSCVCIYWVSSLLYCCLILCITIICWSLGHQYLCGWPFDSNKVLWHPGLLWSIWDIIVLKHFPILFAVKGIYFNTLTPHMAYCTVFMSNEFSLLKSPKGWIRPEQLYLVCIFFSSVNFCSKGLKYTSGQRPPKIFLWPRAPNL